MKSKPVFETLFEQTLADFEVTPLPSEWKLELIENAVLEAAIPKKSRRSPLLKLTIGALAACWVAIGALQLTTPSPTDAADTGIVESTDLVSDQLPIVAAYFVRIKSSDLNQ